MEYLGESANYWHEGLLRYNFYDNVTGLVSLSQVFRGGFQFYIHLKVKIDPETKVGYIEAR